MDPLDGSRALSQAEIDALLNEVAHGSLEPEPSAEQRWKDVKAYDFRKPDKLSKDQMRTLQLLHESFARQASSSLSAYLRTAVQLNLMSIEQGIYGEFVEQMTSDTLMHILSMDPLPGNMLIGIDMTSCMAAVDRLLGGPGIAPAEARVPTEIELALMQTVVANMLRALADAWSKVVNLKPAVRDVVLDPRVLQVALKGDPVVAVTFELGMFQHAGVIAFCLPHSVLEPALPKLTAQMWFASAGRGGTSHVADLRRNLEGIDVELSVELGSTWVALGELGKLREGDVLLLDTASGQPLDLLVGGRRKFRCRPGMVGNRMAAQIVGRVEELELLAQSGQTVES